MFNRSFLRRRKVSQLPQSFVQYSAGAAGDQFGYSCALSSDGTTAIVGQPYDDNAKGADAGSAVVFIRSGKTWTEQAVLTYSAGAADDWFGLSVALSSDGNTAICGMPRDNPGGLNSGSAVVFTRSGATWTQQAVLTYSSAAASDFFGASVALSSDGNTAICGSPTNLAGNGRSVVFTRSGATWTQQAVLTYSAGAAGDQLGLSVALSSDGNTAIAGAPYADPGGVSNAGVAVVFTRSGATWTEQTALTYSSKADNDKFGYSVALSGDGNVVIGGMIGAPSATAVGAAVMFARNNGVWNQQLVLSYLSGAVGDYLGWAVALSTDSNVAIAGAPEIGSSVGGAAIFYNH